MEAETTGGPMTPNLYPVGPMATPYSDKEFSADAIIHRLKEQERIRKAILGELKDNVHYGKVTGIEKKFLWQPGANKIASSFNVTPRYETKVLEDGAVYRVSSMVTLLSRSSGNMVAMGPERAASSEERKFAARVDKRRFTEDLIGFIRGQAESGATTDAIKGSLSPKARYGQVYSSIKYTIYDCLKAMSAEQMIEVAETALSKCEPLGALKDLICSQAQKRAYVHAVRIMAAVDDEFTQDEDMVEDVKELTLEKPVTKVEVLEPLSPKTDTTEKVRKATAEQLTALSKLLASKKKTIPTVMDEHGWKELMPTFVQAAQLIQENQ